MKIVLPVLVVVAGGSLLYHHISATSSSSTATVTKGTVVEEVSASGNVSSVQNVDLSFPRSGIVSTQPVDVGTVVHAGQVLARLDTSTLQAQLQAAQATVSLARAQGGTSENSASTVQQAQDTLVTNAYQKLLASGLVAEPQVTTNTLQAPTITGPYTGPEGTYKIYITSTQPGYYRIRTTGIEDIDPQPISKTAPTSLGTYGLTISFPQDISDYLNSVWHIDVPNTKSSVYAANLNAYNAAVATRAQAIAAAQASTAHVQGVSASEAQIQSAEANVQNIQTQIAQSTIIAPFDGTITAENAKLGATVTVGTPIITLATSGALEVTLDVSEDNIANVKIGDPVRMTLDAFGKQNFEGKVVKIDPAAITVGGATYYKTTVTFNNPNSRIREGMTVNAYIQTATADNALMVPASAVTTHDGASTVSVLQNGTKKVVSVTTGLVNQAGMVQVTSGLTSGEVVITGQQP